MAADPRSEEFLNRVHSQYVQYSQSLLQLHALPYASTLDLRVHDALSETPNFLIVDSGREELYFRVVFEHPLL